MTIEINYTYLDQDPGYEDRLLATNHWLAMLSGLGRLGIDPNSLSVPELCEKYDQAYEDVLHDTDES